jgi:hypothetical protein
MLVALLPTNLSSDSMFPVPFAYLVHYFEAVMKPFGRVPVPAATTQQQQQSQQQFRVQGPCWLAAACRGSTKTSAVASARSHLCCLPPLPLNGLLPATGPGLAFIGAREPYFAMAASLNQNVAAEDSQSITRNKLYGTVGNLGVKLARLQDLHGSRYGVLSMYPPAFREIIYRWQKPQSRVPQA